MHVLLVEDSRRLQESLSTGLRKSGYAVDVASDGEAALTQARRTDYDVIVLDLMLPKVDGMTVLRQLRERSNKSHVLILTAKAGVEDRILGLRSGADDYLVKPFAFDELLARVEAMVRRSYGQKNPVIRIGALAIDTAARSVTRQQAPVDLSRREYALLEYLAFRRGAVVERRRLQEHLYADCEIPESNAIDRTVCTLRRKLARAGEPGVLSTRRGIGYVLEGSSR